MPIYFNDIPPFCPISKDQPVGPMLAPAIRTTVPHVFDLPTALKAVNILRSIVIQIISHRVTNNVFTPKPPKPRKQPPDKTIDRRRRSRWAEIKKERVKRRYKYYGKDENGEKDEDTWVMTERIEKMVWADKGWRTRLVFMYGDKGEGEPMGPAKGGSSDAGGVV